MQRRPGTRLIVKIVGEALARIIELTPVDSGKARGGWGVTVAGTGSQDPGFAPGTGQVTGQPHSATG